MNEDPNQHYKRSLNFYDTFKYNGVFDDAICFQLFPFSLFDDTFMWLDSQSINYITMWDELTNRFLAQHFPLRKIMKLTMDITNFL